MTKRIRFFGFLALTIGCLFAFENCGKPFSVALLSADWASQASVQPNCLDGTADACVFRKNVVSQSGQALRNNDLGDLSAEQTYAVQLNGWTTNQSLSNGSFTVLAMGAQTPLSADPATQFRIAGTSPAAQSALEQVMAFYWANQTAYQAAQLGPFAAGNKQILIMTDSSLQGWALRENQIHLKAAGAANPLGMAFDAGTLIYYLGIANLDFATNGAIHSETQANHVSCQNAGTNCCASASGCSRAIASGQADYLVALMFPDRPQVSDGWSNLPQGAAVCGQTGVTRDPSGVASLTASQAYSLCAGAGQSGNIYAMGLVYAAFWLDLRKAAGADASQVDRLYLEHLALLDGDDDFQTALAKITQLDQTLFSGSHAGLISGLGAARGF